MKKNIIVKGVLSVVAAVMFVMVGSNVGVAQERQPGVSVGFNAGAAWCLDGYLSTGVTGRAFVEYAAYIHEIGLKLTAGYWRFDDSVSAGEGPLREDVDVLFTNWYFTGGGVYRLSRKNITPFLAANLGAYNYEDEQINLSASGAPVSDVKDGWGVGVNGGGGVEFFSKNTYSIGIESLAHFVFGEESYQLIDVTLMFRFL